MGVESLLTLLIMPGFRQLIKLEEAQIGHLEHSGLMPHIFGNNL